MQKKRGGLKIWILLLAACAGGVWAWFHFHEKAAANGTSYKTVALERGNIVQSVTANGSLSAVKTVAVGSEVSGKIMELFADYNSVVTNGQILAQLDASTYERQLDQAEAELESAKASLKLAEANFRRATELRGLELVSQADYDQSEASRAQAQASLRMREASLSKVKVDLEKTTIFSPMDGVVISRAVDVGQTVAASLNAPTLFTLAQDLRAMRIEAQISEADVGGVAEGQSVSFTVDAYPTRTFSGKVNQVRFEPITTQGVVNYVAIVDVENSDLKLRPGMTANATIETARREAVLRLPNAALRFRPADGVVVAPPAPPPPPPPAAAAHGEKKKRGGGTDAPERKEVYALNETGGLNAQPVRLGISDGSWTEVLEPSTAEGSQIVTGTQSAADKGKSSATTGGSSPFMPQRPRGGGGGGGGGGGPRLHM